METEIRQGYLNPEQRNPTPLTASLWRDMATPSEADDLRARIAAFELAQTPGGCTGLEEFEYPPAIQAMRDRLRVLDGMEERARLIETYRAALRNPDLSMQHRTEIEAYLRKVTPAPVPDPPAILDLQPIQDNETREWRVTVPSVGKGGTQVFKAPTLKDLVSRIAVAHYHASVKIKRMSQELKNHAI